LRPCFCGKNYLHVLNFSLLLKSYSEQNLLIRNDYYKTSTFECTGKIVTEIDREIDK
jgi:hypothetical protein